MDQCACAAKVLVPTLHCVPEMVSLFPRIDQRPICDDDRMAYMMTNGGQLDFSLSPHEVWMFHSTRVSSRNMAISYHTGYNL